MQKRVVVTFAIMQLSLAACVTINIYFPAAAAEKAADKIIDEVWQLKQDANASKPAKPTGENKGDVK